MQKELQTQYELKAQAKEKFLGIHYYRLPPKCHCVLYEDCPHVEFVRIATAEHNTSARHLLKVRVFQLAKCSSAEHRVVEPSEISGVREYGWRVTYLPKESCHVL